MKKKVLGLIILSTLIFLGSFLKISFGLGGYKFFFSGINFFVPLVGSILSLPIASFFVGLLFFIKKMTLGGMITLGLPTIVATLTWGTMFRLEKQKTVFIELANCFFRFVLPIIAIILFILHPIGQQAFIYSFYWLIPVALYLLQKFNIHDSIFTKALTTTFIAHAIGSLMWLYLVPMTSVQWLSLIPIVAVERLVFACGMSLGYLFIRKLNFVPLFKRLCLGLVKN